MNTGTVIIVVVLIVAGFLFYKFMTPAKKVPPIQQTSGTTPIGLNTGTLAALGGLATTADNIFGGGDDSDS